MNRDADVCGVILAGGKSLRMGRDKALIEIDGIPLIRRLADILLGLTDHVVVSANDRAAYKFLGLPVVTDTFNGQGPLAGLHAAMVHSPLPLFLVVACDLPRIHAALLRRLVQLCPGYDAVVPRTSSGQMHPLSALYRRSCLEPIGRRLKASLNQFTALLEDPLLRIRWLPPEEGSYAEDDLCNLNSPSDLHDFRHSGRNHTD